jgi:hypothetical protein
MALPSGAAPHSKKPRGRYTARLLTRLPFCGSAVALSIAESGNGCILSHIIAARAAPSRRAQGMATMEGCG